MGNSRAYQAFKLLQHWKPSKRIIAVDKLFNRNSKYYPLIQYMYKRTQDFYSRFPLRKNGEPSFTHPVNVVLALREANVTDEITLLAGLTHDIIEERVDLHRDANKIKESPQGIQDLDKYEETIYPHVQEELTEVCLKNNIDPKIVDGIIAIIKVLTRHKRDFYYQSICQIFTMSDPVLKEKAMVIKLADRMHNILCIECFSEEQRIYQCFKTLFILNSVKKHLLQKYGENFLQTQANKSLVLLFKRCCKATYDAFLTICHSSHSKGIGSVKSILQLAFKKFALERSGVREVTNINKKEMHPIRLYGNIIRKYDFRLQHKKNKYEEIKQDEREYCKEFFADMDFNDQQIKAILDYKDAYALKETISYLLYWPEYILKGFSYEDMFNEN